MRYMHLLMMSAPVVNQSTISSISGLAENGMANNFVVMKPKKKWISFQPKIEQSEEIDNILEQKGIDFDYIKRK
jgi:hypothetical protein